MQVLARSTHNLLIQQQLADLNTQSRFLELSRPGSGCVCSGDHRADSGLELITRE